LSRIGSSGHLIAIGVAALVGAVPCAPTAGEGREAPGGTPSATSRRASGEPWIWVALYSYRRESAKFVSLDPEGRTVYVEATSPNLELASIVGVARGRLPAETTRRLGDALQAIGRMDASAIASLQPIEPIEERGLLADVAFAHDGMPSHALHLALDKMPPEMSRALSEAAAAASKLAPDSPPSVIQAWSVDASRAERIRMDPRAIYRFVPVRQKSLGDSPRLLTALRHPGLVVETTDREDRLVREWLRSSNVKRTSNTLFLEIEGDDLRGVFQIHVPEMRAAPR
jgi:hypothetical protein